MEIFWNTIAQYNEGTWWAQFIITLAGIALTLLLYRKPTLWVKRSMKIYMAFLNGWISVVYYMIKSADLSSKSIALFGCGDSDSYGDTFCDGIGVLYEDLKDSGCTFLGNKVNTSGYSFSSSIAIVDGTFVGLALDEVNESDKTAGRIDDWTTELKSKI